MAGLNLVGGSGRDLGEENISWPSSCLVVSSLVVRRRKRARPDSEARQSKATTGRRSRMAWPAESRLELDKISPAEITPIYQPDTQATELRVWSP